jgi:sugar phosphate isomerase/epimerase
MKMKIGCHAVMFAAKLATDTVEVVNEIATTGFQGIEAGNRFVAIDKREVLMNSLKENGLELAAIHYNIQNWITDPNAAIAGAVEEAKFMAETPNKNVNFSFMPTEDMDFDSVVNTFNEAAKACSQYGVSLNYHNHWAEFANGGKFYHTLIEKAPDLHFAFDLGWVYRGGFDPIAVLKEAQGRCTYVHLRDPDDGPENAVVNGRKFYLFPELGNGKTDLKAQLSFLKDYMPEDGWVVVEYEGGEPDVNRYIRAKKVIDSLL